jgi:phosphoribosyl 1,2-cyclic phosphate phosphodiesterase
MTLRVTILGCGSSGGVPRVAQGWGVCDPANPRNRRRRCSILVEQIGPDGTTRILVDTSPDLREQLIDAGVKHLDAILMTHPHADHTNGIDDVRPLVIHMKRRLDIFMDEPTSDVVRRAFGYIFETPEGSNYPPLLIEHRLHAGKICTIEGAGGALSAMPMLLDHGEIDSLGFRFKDVAYTPDVKRIYPQSEPHLYGLDLWIIDALRHTKHSTHFSIPDALEMIRHFKPKRAILTNLSSEVDYAQLAAEVPDNVSVAHDMMRIEF